MDVAGCIVNACASCAIRALQLYQVLKVVFIMDLAGGEGSTGAKWYIGRFYRKDHVGRQISLPAFEEYMGTTKGLL